MPSKRAEIFRFDRRYMMNGDEVKRLGAVVWAANLCRRRIEIEPDGKFDIVLSVVVPAPKAVIEAATPLPL